MLRRMTIATILLVFGISTILNVSSAAAASAMPLPVVRVTTPKKTTLAGIVRISRLRVRDGASVRTKTRFMLVRNTHVTVLGLSTNRHWLKIRTSDGRIGWVSAAYIKLIGGRFRNLPKVQ